MTRIEHAYTVYCSSSSFFFHNLSAVAPARFLSFNQWQLTYTDYLMKIQTDTLTK